MKIFKKLFTKKFIATFLIGIIMTTSLNVYASDEKMEDKLETLTKEYNLVNVDENDMPENVIPVEITLDELELFLEEAEEYNNDNNITIETNLNSSRMSRSYVRGKMPGAFLGLNVTLELWCNYETSNSKISRAGAAGWSLPGFTPGVSITSPSASGTVSSGKLYVDGQTDVEYYLLIDGFVKLYTVAINGNYTYSYNGTYSNVNLEAVN